MEAEITVLNATKLTISRFYVQASALVTELFVTVSKDISVNAKLRQLSGSGIEI